MSVCLLICVEQSVVKNMVFTRMPNSAKENLHVSNFFNICRSIK